PSPRGKGWSPHAIYELVRNPIYRGERIFNRTEWVKDHETGRRRRFDRPAEEWVRQHDEGWRIVSEGLWQSAQEATMRRGVANRRSEDGGGPVGTVAGSGDRGGTQNLFAGGLPCGGWGGGLFCGGGAGRCLLWCGG